MERQLTVVRGVCGLFIHFLCKSVLLISASETFIPLEVHLHGMRSLSATSNMLHSCPGGIFIVNK